MEDGGYTDNRWWEEAVRHGFWTPKGFMGRYDDKPRLGPNEIRDPFGFPNHPAVGVTWYEVAAFCRWLTKRFEAHLPSGWGISLPSEAEWEKAARGGEEIATPGSIEPVALSKGLSLSINVRKMQTNPAPERAYPWGNDFSAELCNTDDTGIGTTSANGCFKNGESPYGVEEMSGNAWEWTRNFVDGREDMKQLTENDGFVLRGGAFNYGSSFARSAFRYGLSPYVRFRYIGFRVVASPFRL